MPTDHPLPEQLESFLLNRSDALVAGRRREVARHLLTGCGFCARQLHALGWDETRLNRLLIVPAARPEDDEEAHGEDDEEDEEGEKERQGARRRGRYNYDRAFARAEEAVTQLLAAGQVPDRLAARELAPLLAELDSSSPEEQERRMLDDSRLARPLLVHCLIERSRRARPRDLLTMLRQANLARLSAEACSAPAAGGRRRLADLRALAWSEYGSALRLGVRLAEASRALGEAERWRQRGTGDPLLRAALSRHLAALRDLSLLYAALGDADQAARTLSRRRGHLFTPASAVALFRHTSA